MKVKDKFSLLEIARGFESIRTKSKDASVAFGGFKLNDLTTVLLTAIDWNEALSDVECERIVGQAPFEAGATGMITEASLSKALLQLEKAQLAKAPIDYVAVFTLSLRHHIGLKKLVLNGVHFSFHSKLPRGFERKGIHDSRFADQIKDLPNGYVVVCARVCAKSVYAAISQAMSALGVMRAIWNYVINRRTINLMRIRSGTPSKAIALNKIRLGPVHTVHLRDGSLATQEWWCDPLFEAAEQSDLNMDWPRIQKSASWCLRRYHACNYAKDATAMWVRYAYAFDDADHEATFFKLWGLLEFLTGTVGGPYDKTIERTLFVCSDREFHRMILLHLRERRNAFVHRGDGSSEVEQYVFQLKSYVEELLRLHLVLGDDFKSLADFGQFLDLPDDPLVLRQKLHLLGRALRFRENTLTANG